jgi:hypothetical protein
MTSLLRCLLLCCAVAGSTHSQADSPLDETRRRDLVDAHNSWRSQVWVCRYRLPGRQLDRPAAVLSGPHVGKRRCVDFFAAACAIHPVYAVSVRML